MEARREVRVKVAKDAVRRPGSILPLCLPSKADLSTPGHRDSRRNVKQPHPTAESQGGVFPYRDVHFKLITRHKIKKKV